MRVNCVLFYYYVTSLDVDHFLLYIIMKDTQIVIPIYLIQKGPKTSPSNSLMSVLYDPIGHYDRLIYDASF
jgi:hypothetical protein